MELNNVEEKTELYGLSEYYLDLIRDHVTKYEFARVGVKTTICVLTMNNGFEQIGTSACVNPSDFNTEIGNRCALKDALVNVDPLVGYARHSK
jgi:hypothetical protein